MELTSLSPRRDDEQRSVAALMSTANESNEEATPPLSPTSPTVKPITSAGVLPFTVYRKRVYFLLGREGFEHHYRGSDTWCDFSGSVEAGESVEDGAAREFYEETAGCVLELETMRSRLHSGQYLLHSDLHPRSSASYRVYLVAVPYHDYATMFRRSKRFVQYTGGSIDTIEKSQLAWFSFADLRDGVFHVWGERYKRKPKMRPKFSETMRRIMTASDLEQDILQYFSTTTCASSSPSSSFSSSSAASSLSVAANAAPLTSATR